MDRNIPNLLNTLAPQSCFFTQVINRGILGHYVATASIATGAYETFDNFVAQPPVHPTIFEYLRRDLRRPAEDAWVIAPGSLFAQMGSSRNRRYGPDEGAEVVLPKRLLGAVLGSTNEMQLDSYPSILRDSYEMPAAPDVPSSNCERESMEALLARMNLDNATLKNQAAKFASPDELSVYMTKHVMRTFRPLCFSLHSTISTSRIPAPIRFTSKEFAAQIASAVSCGTKSSRIRNTRTKPRS